MGAAGLSYVLFPTGFLDLPGQLILTNLLKTQFRSIYTPLYFPLAEEYPSRPSKFPSP